MTTLRLRDFPNCTVENVPDPGDSAFLRYEVGEAHAALADAIVGFLETPEPQAESPKAICIVLGRVRYSGPH